jgi:hypothetical protein
MLKDRDIVEIPPPKGDASGGKTTPIDDTPKGSCVEQLSCELMQPKLQKRLTGSIRSLKSLKIGN